MKCAFFMALLSLQFCCCGCWPYRFTTFPAVAGRVIDDNTGAPVDGVEVLVSREGYRFAKDASDPVTHELKPGATPQPPPMNEAIKRALPLIVSTTADGAFAIPRQTRWGLFVFLPVDYLSPGGSLVIRREGYHDLMVDVRSYEPVDLGTIRLKPVPCATAPSQ